MNEHIPKFVPITDLRQDAAAVLRSIQAGEEPIVIMQRSRAAAVMLSVDTYERMTYEREVLGILAKGESDIKAARGIGIEQVLTELDELLSKDSS
ncbi:type II toxin-antitoxin system Phd/YefM family antitoxin [Candidatus Bipolaricaulota bacterium]